MNPADKGKVRFIRVRGKVVPIRGDKGIDLRGQKKNVKDLSGKEKRKVFKQAASKTKQPSRGKRIKAGFALGTVATGFFAGAGAAGGAALGGALGSAGVALGKMKSGAGLRMAAKLGKTGAALGAAIGVAGGVGIAADKSRVANNRQYNKAYGKALAKKNSTGF